MSAVRRAPGHAYPLAVGVIGAGRVGAVLGAALAAAGHHVVATAAVSAASRDRAARLLPQAAIRPADEVARAARFVPQAAVGPADKVARAARLLPEAAMRPADEVARLSPQAAVGPADEVARAATGLLLLAVPDDALAAVVDGLARTGALQPDQVVAHTSGAHGLDVLQGVRGFALHPAMTFTGTAADLDRLPGTAYGLTAPPDLKPLAARLVTDLGGVPEWIAETDRPVYHAALAHGANHLVTLVNEASDLLRAAGVGEPAAVLSPLLHAALDNALRLGDAALTGPVSRGDAGTVRKHLERMPADAVPAYLALARRTADRAIASGRLRPRDADLLLDVLAQVTEGAR